MQQSACTCKIIHGLLLQECGEWPKAIKMWHVHVKLHGHDLLYFLSHQECIYTSYIIMRSCSHLVTANVHSGRHHAHSFSLPLLHCSYLHLQHSLSEFVCSQFILCGIIYQVRPCRYATTAYPLSHLLVSYLFACQPESEYYLTGSLGLGTRLISSAIDPSWWHSSEYYKSHRCVILAFSTK